jgi:hypothetical protein
LVERTVGLEVEKAYEELKVRLLEKNCKITADEAPTLISVRQGSLWGITPVTAKKKLHYRLIAAESVGTRITCSSSLEPDWKNLTIIGCVLSVAVIALCLWMTADLDALVSTQQQGFWGWIVTVSGYVDVPTAQFFAGLMRMLAVFLAFILAAEGAIVAYVYFKINKFAEETLNML